MNKRLLFICTMSMSLFLCYDARAVWPKELLDNTMQSTLYKVFTSFSALALTGYQSYSLYKNIYSYKQKLSKNSSSCLKKTHLMSIGKDVALTAALGSLTVFSFYYSNKGWYVCSSCSKAL